MTVLTVIASIVGIVSFVFQLFGWLKIEPNGVKKFIAIRGRTLAWNAYLIVAALFTIYLLLFFILSVLSAKSFSISLATLLVLILWGLLGGWAPAIQRLRNKRINVIVDIVTICLMILTVVGFWIVKWPEIRSPVLVTLGLLAIVVIYVVDRIVKRRKPAGRID